MRPDQQRSLQGLAFAISFILVGCVTTFAALYLMVYQGWNLIAALLVPASAGTLAIIYVHASPA